jgi:hypothetical protein
MRPAPVPVGVEEKVTWNNEVVRCVCLVVSKPVGKDTPYPSQDQDAMIDNDDDDANDERFVNPADYYGDDDDEDEEEEVLGHDAVGSSPLAIDRAETEAVMNGGISPVQAVAVSLHNSANPLPIRAGKWQVLGLA